MGTGHRQLVAPLNGQRTQPLLVDETRGGMGLHQSLTGAQARRAFASRRGRLASKQTCMGSSQKAYQSCLAAALVSVVGAPAINAAVTIMAVNPAT